MLTSSYSSPTVPIWTTWQHWFASDAVGIITVAPLVIGLAEALRKPPPRNEIVEGLVALAALAVVMIVIIVLLPPEPWQTVRSAALLLPILLWLTARCQPVFAAAAAFVVSLMTVWTITFGIGHFGDPGLPTGDRILDAQATIVAFTLYAYVLAALFAERRQHEAVLEEGGAVAGSADGRGGDSVRVESSQWPVAAQQERYADPGRWPTAEFHRRTIPGAGSSGRPRKVQGARRRGSRRQSVLFRHSDRRTGPMGCVRAATGRGRLWCRKRLVDLAAAAYPQIAAALGGCRRR
jgi:MASE1